MKYLDGNGALLINNAYMFNGSPTRISIGNNTFHGQMTFTRYLFDLVGGYPEVWQAHDIKFIEKIPKEYIDRKNTPIDEISYIYRWANGQRNLSSMFLRDDPETTLNRITEFRNNQLKSTEYQKIELVPKWLADYHDITQKYFSNNSHCS